MAYYTLVSRAANETQWAVEFGDYERECVNEEMREMRYQHQLRGEGDLILKIIRTKTARQSEINERIAAENALLKTVHEYTHNLNPFG